jgi:hypothetical protein
MGNYEMISLFGARPVYSSRVPLLDLARAKLAVKQTRIDQSPPHLTQRQGSVFRGFKGVLGKPPKRGIPHFPDPCNNKHRL